MPQENIKQKSYIFLDESGKPEVFSRRGINLVEVGTASKFLVIAAIKTPDHVAIQEAVTSEQLKMLQDKNLSLRFSPSYSLNAFHAQTDYPEVKERFYQFIKNTDLDLKISVIVAEKEKAYHQLQIDAARLYATVAGQLLKRISHTTQNTEVIFSRRDASLKAREKLQEIIEELRTHFAKQHGITTETKITYYHNPHYTHGGLQISDYVAHAVFQVCERNKREWYEIIKKRIGYIQDIFNKKSYSRKNPL